MDRSLTGGDAYAINIDDQTQLQDFKNGVAEMFSCSADNVTIKYFVPCNKKTLITISRDKDLQRMVQWNNCFGGSHTNCSHSMPCDMLMETRDEPPLKGIPPGSGDEKTRKAALALQWENMIMGVDQRYKKNDSQRVSVKCNSPGCPWRIYASRLSMTQLICIKKMNENHTCEGGNVKAGYRLTRGRTWVGNIIKEKLKESPNYKPKEIALDIKEYEIELNYFQGSYKDRHKLLPFFCERIKETNPGSVATFSTKEDMSFHRLFVSFHACISGFELCCRPLMFLDSVPLLSKYHRALLAAVSVDGDDAT